MDKIYYRGSCLCGEIQYEISEKLGDIVQCHCQKCRKATGTAFATNAPIPKQAFHLYQGQNFLKSYASSKETMRFFCSQCGSPVYAIQLAAPDIYRIRLGLIDDDIHEPISKHVYVGSKANWDEILDGRPQFLTYPK